MAAMISSEARWLVPGRPGAAGATAGSAAEPTPVPSAAPTAKPAPSSAAPRPTDHRLRRRLGHKCASVLAGASVSLGLAAARIPAAVAQSGPSGAGVIVTESVHTEPLAPRA